MDFSSRDRELLSKPFDGFTLKKSFTLKKIFPVFICCCSILLSETATAQSIKKWYDADGNLHFGDVPPPSVVPEKFDVTPTSEATLVTKKQMEIYRRTRAAEHAEWEAQSAAMARSDRAKRAACDRAREQYRNYDIHASRGPDSTAWRLRDEIRENCP